MVLKVFILFVRAVLSLHLQDLNAGFRSASGRSNLV